MQTTAHVSAIKAQESSNDPRLSIIGSDEVYQSTSVEDLVAHDIINKIEPITVPCVGEPQRPPTIGERIAASKLWQRQKIFEIRYFKYKTLTYTCEATGQTNSILICLLCGRTNKSQRKMEEHLRSHRRSEDRFYCAQCKIQFHTKAGLVYHDKVRHQAPY